MDSIKPKQRALSKLLSECGEKIYIRKTCLPKINGIPVVSIWYNQIYNQFAYMCFNENKLTLLQLKKPLPFELLRLFNIQNINGKSIKITKILFRNQKSTNNPWDVYNPWIISFNTPILKESFYIFNKKFDDFDYLKKTNNNLEVFHDFKYSKYLKVIFENNYIVE